MECGLYIVTSRSGDRLNGQIANTVFQVTSQPPRIATSLSKSNLTHEYIAESGVFTVCVMAEEAPFAFIGPFGFRSGRVINKLEGISYVIGINGCPVITDHVVASIEARVTDSVDVGTHTLFIGDVVSARLLHDARPMTYAFYQQNLKGKTPVDSPTYIPEE
ncbi:MAG: flavin reductase [Candidatus Zixiibacteriota bacterium]|nr:MAG: flavin reductase [candidate division Zixibacteria bacterium]